MSEPVDISSPLMPQEYRFGGRAMQHIAKLRNNSRAVIWLLPNSTSRQHYGDTRRYKAEEFALA